MPGNDRAESKDTSQDEKTRQLGLRGIIILPGWYQWVTFVCSKDNTLISFIFFRFLETVLLQLRLSFIFLVDSQDVSSSCVIFWKCQVSVLTTMRKVDHFNQNWHGKMPTGNFSSNFPRGVRCTLIASVETRCCECKRLLSKGIIF